MIPTPFRPPTYFASRLSLAWASFDASLPPHPLGPEHPFFSAFADGAAEALSEQPESSAEPARIPATAAERAREGLVFVRIAGSWFGYADPMRRARNRFAGALA